jgi:hypothetical protein
MVSEAAKSALGEIYKVIDQEASERDYWADIELSDRLTIVKEAGVTVLMPWDMYGREARQKIRALLIDRRRRAVEMAARLGARG